MLFREAQELTGRQSQVVEIEKFKAKIASVQQQIEATTERITELPKGLDATVFYNQILKLQKAKEEFEEKLTNLKSEEVLESPIRLEDFQKFTESLKSLATKTTDPNKQALICRKLIQKIEVSPTGITLLLFLKQQLKKIRKKCLNLGDNSPNCPTISS